MVGVWFIKGGSLRKRLRDWGGVIWVEGGSLE